MSYIFLLSLSAVYDLQYLCSFAKRDVYVLRTKSSKPYMLLGQLHPFAELAVKALHTRSYIPLLSQLSMARSTHIKLLSQPPTSSTLDLTGLR